mgnify:CR=1 FL=1
MFTSSEFWVYEVDFSQIYADRSRRFMQIPVLRCRTRPTSSGEPKNKREQRKESSLSNKIFN